MQVVKPDTLTVLPRILEWGPACLLVVTGLAGFRLSDPAAGFLNEAELWAGITDALGEDQALDAGYPKSAAEALLIGSARAPGNRPTPAMKVRLKFGNIDKSLNVFGDRVWEMGLAGLKPGAPRPFIRMPLGYGNAFGGPGFGPNPIGKGFSPLLTPDGIKQHPLPNIQHPRDLMASPADRPDPAGFGPLDIAWPQRKPKTGTYDDRWLQFDWPAVPRDFDEAAFNTAPVDQRLASWPRCDEAFILEGVHPEITAMASRLPGWMLRVYLTRLIQGRENSMELGLRIDTVWFLPDQDLGVVAFRGQTRVADDECSEVVHLYAVMENLGEYRPTAARPDEAATGLRAVEPAPAAETAAQPAVEPPPAPEPNPEMLELEKQIKQAEDDLRAQLAKLGLDYDRIAAKTVTPPKPAMPEMTLEEAEAQLNRLLKQAGIDPTAVEAAAPLDLARISFDPQATIQSLAASGLLTPELKESVLALHRDLEQTKAALRVVPPPSKDEAKTPEPGPTPALNRESIAAQYAQGRRDFSNLDLSGLDLSELDLGGIRLNASTLTGVKFTGSRLVEADLTGADLSLADCGQADLTGAVLNRVVGIKMNLAGGKMAGAKLMRADLTQAVLAQADLSAAQASGAILVEANLEGAKLTGCDLSAADLDRTALSGADFSQAHAPDLSLHGAQGTAAVFQKSVIPRFRADQATVLAGANFSAADMRSSYLGGADLAGAVFTEARLTGATFQKCRLAGANFHHAQARDARFLHCDLTWAVMTGMDLLHASLSKSRCENTRFSGSNLFEVDTLKTIFLDAKFDRANLKRTRIMPARPKS